MKIASHLLQQVLHLFLQEYGVQILAINHSAGVSHSRGGGLSIRHRVSLCSCQRSRSRRKPTEEKTQEETQRKNTHTHVGTSVKNCLCVLVSSNDFLCPPEGRHYNTQPLRSFSVERWWCQSTIGGRGNAGGRQGSHWQIQRVSPRGSRGAGCPQTLCMQVSRCWSRTRHSVRAILSPIDTCRSGPRR